MLIERTLELENDKFTLKMELSRFGMYRTLKNTLGNLALCK